MKHNIHSISFKLIIGGCLVVLIPLVVVGIITTGKSSQALQEQASALMEIGATDIADLVNNVLLEEKKLATAYASNSFIRDVSSQVLEKGVEGAGESVKRLRLAMKDMYGDLGKNYLGIFVTDISGKLYTGERANGSEYKGSDVSTRGYFQEAKRTKKAVVGNLVKSKSTGKLIVVFCAPILSEDGKFLGIFGMPFKAEALTELVNRVKLGKTGYALMVDKTGLLIAHPNQENLLTLNLAEEKGTETVVETVLSGKKGAMPYTFRGVEKFAGYAPVSLKGWGVMLTQNKEELLASSTAIRNSILLVTLIALVGVVSLVIIFSRKITGPLNLAVESLKDIAQGDGDLTKRLPVKSKDEIGEMAEWFNVFIDKLQGIIRRLSGNANVVGTSSSELTGISGELSDGAVETAHRAENLATASEEMSTNLNNVAAAMEQSATNTSMVAAAAEEMTSTISEIAENAERARNISEDAVGKAQVTSEKMGQLGTAAKKIGQVTETITEISEQTNLLALNATIEAARAGEAGKGFAVVANEIKDLAKQTAEATLDIKHQIDDVQQATEMTVTDIEQISVVIRSVNEIVATITIAVEEQSGATQEIANNINQASMGIQEVNENVGQSSVVAAEINRDIAEVNNAATGISNGSASVKESAENLAALAAELTKIVNTFKV